MSVCRYAHAAGQVPDLADPGLAPLATWRHKLRLVRDFLVRHGRLPRCHGGTPEAPLTNEERGLGFWCVIQRQRWRGSKHHPVLSPVQVAALEAVPGWQWSPWAEAWERQWQELMAFVQQHGRLPARGRSPLKGERALARWCETQRSRIRGQGHWARLTPEQASKLEAIPGWQWDPWTVEWERQWQEVKAFTEQHGRLPRRFCTKGQPEVPGEEKLGVWCKTQQQRAKGQGTWAPLTPEQGAKLEALPGWQWDQRTTEWEQRWQEVAAFVQRHGQLPRQSGGVVRPLVGGERELGTWCAWQRQRQRKQGRKGAPLGPEHAAKVEAIPGWYW